MSRVSIIMSTYNTPYEYLKASISSILNQTFNDFEFIIIDDGSSDNDSDIVRQFKDERIVLVQNENNRGLAYSLNRAIDMAKCEYIMRMDSDDIAFSERIERQVSFMDENPDVDICSCRAVCFGAKDGYPIIDYGDNDYVKAALFFSDVILHPTVIMRRDSLNRYSLRYDENLRRAQDYDLWVRASSCCNFHILSDILLRYRCHDKQATIVARNEQLKVCKALYLNYIKMLGIDVSDGLYDIHRTLKGTNFEEAKLLDVLEYHKIVIDKNNAARIFDVVEFKKLMSGKLVKSCTRLLLKRKLRFKLFQLLKLYSFSNIKSTISYMLMIKRFKRK